VAAPAYQHCFLCRWPQAECPSSYDEDCDYFVTDICSFPIVVKDLCKSGLPDPATAKTLLEKGMNVGAVPDVPVLRLSRDDPCGPIVSKYTVKGRGFVTTQGNPADGSQVSWKGGGFLLISPAGLTSQDPRVPDQVASLLVLSGRITLRVEDGALLKYSGAAPIDVCKKLA
jgi:hypothetical protein